MGRPNLAKANAATIESIIAGGGTIKEAAIVIGVSYLTVSKYWRDTHGKTKKNWTDEEREEVKKLRDSGLTYSEIGKRKGVSESSVRHQVEYVERLSIGT